MSREGKNLYRLGASVFLVFFIAQKEAVIPANAGIQNISRDGLDSRIRGNDGRTKYQLLTTSFDDFDFRDRTNRVIDGDREAVKELFLYSAWNLLVLGNTMPKIAQGRLFDALQENLKHFYLFTKKLLVMFGACLASVGRSLGRSRSSDKQGNLDLPHEAPPLRRGASDLPFQFTGALIPLRL